MYAVKIEHALRNIKIFKGLDDESLYRLRDKLEEKAVIKKVPRKCIVIDEDSVPLNALLLLSGSARNYKTTVEGREHVIGHYSGSALLTLLLPLMNQTPHFGYVVTLEPSEIAVVPARSFFEAYETIPNVAKCINTCIFRRAERATHLSDILRLNCARNRILALLMKECTPENDYTYVFPFTVSDLAYFLNMARPTVSKELHLLEGMGVLQYHKNSIKLLDPSALERLLIL